MHPRFPLPTTLSLDTWLALDEDAPGELVDGHLEPEELVTLAHELTVSWLIHTLRTWLVPRGGLVLASNFKLVICRSRGRKPDALAYFARPVRDSSSLSAPPSIVVEVLTATPRDRRRDRVDKQRDYATLGIGQYWLVDPTARTLEVLALDSTRRFLHVFSGAEGTHQIPGCNDLRLDLDDLWADVERGTAFFSSLDPSYPLPIT
jgi:Uma2 family endonuclease